MVCVIPFPVSLTKGVVAGWLRSVIGTLKTALYALGLLEYIEFLFKELKTSKWIETNSIFPHCRSGWTNRVKYRN